MRERFDTRNSRDNAGGREPLLEFFGRHRPQLVVSVLVVIALVGGAFYAARGTENTPKVVYSASLEEVAGEASEPLLINVNTADAAELDELPEVGPVTAQEIIDHRRSNGPFRSVDELEEVPGIGPKTLEKIRPFAEV